MNRRYGLPLLLVVLVACGASQRTKALRATLQATQATQAGFVSWDREHQHGIVVAATSEADGAAHLEAYREARAHVLDAFGSVYRAIAAAALLEKDDRSLTDTLAAAAQLRRVLQKLTGKDLP